MCTHISSHKQYTPCYQFIICLLVPNSYIGQQLANYTKARIQTETAYREVGDLHRITLASVYIHALVQLAWWWTIYEGETSSQIINWPLEWNENQLMSLFYSYIAGSLHVSVLLAHLQESSYSCSHNHWFSICPLWTRALYVTYIQSTRPERTDTEPMVVWTAIRTLLKMGLWARNM